MRDENRLIIAIDFGTTYTGVAAVYSGSPEAIEVIRNWPGGNGISSDKVPTQFTYKVDAEASNAQAATSDNLLDLLAIAKSSGLTIRKNVRWGYEVSPIEQKISCIKLFLDRGQQVPGFVDQEVIFTQLRDANRDIESAIADFLSKVHEHALETLSRRWSHAFVKSTPTEYVLTVPAIFSDKAKDAMKRIAKQAGLGDKLRLASEPEAAAVHTFKAIQPNMLRLNDVFVVCDAGGGTVDLISYTITSIKPLKVVETTVGSGGLCGAQMLNINFEEHVKKRIGEAKFKQYKIDKPKSWRIALDNFEDRVKRWFGAVSMTEFEVPLHGMEDNIDASIEDGCLILTVDQLKSIFDPVVANVIALVEHQVSKVRDQGRKVAAIMCVGGFGQSAYLYTRLKSHFKTELPPPYTPRRRQGPFRHNAAVTDLGNASIEIMQPLNTWTSVLRGAIDAGLASNIIAERQCRYNYGIKMFDIFVEGRHPAHSKYWDDFDKRWCAEDVMSWYIRKVQAVTAERKIKFEMQQIFYDLPQSNDPIHFELQLRASSLEEAPLMYHAASTFTVCTVYADVTEVPRRLFHKRTNSTGEKRWYLDMNFVMKIDSASIEFTVEAAGRTYGIAHASFDH